MEYKEYLKGVQEMFYSNRIGKTYGSFEVIDVAYDESLRKQVWTLRCTDCGDTKKTTNGKDYVKGKNKGTCRNCKRIAVEKSKAKAAKNRKEPKPRMKDHELYRRWSGIKRRCYQKSDKDYKNYGARGITMCDEWKNDFMAFVDWAEKNGYKKDLTIDRIDNDKGYSPDNCRWITREKQAKNKRNVKLYYGMTRPDFCKTHDLNERVVENRMSGGATIEEAAIEALKYGLKKSFNKSCAENGISATTVMRRILRGISVDDAMNPNVSFRQNMIEINGEKKTLKEWCAEYGLTTPAVYYRVKKCGMTYEQAITTPKNPGKKIKA